MSYTQLLHVGAGYRTHDAYVGNTLPSELSLHPCLSFKAHIFHVDFGMLTNLLCFLTHTH